MLTASGLPLDRTSEIEISYPGVEMVTESNRDVRSAGSGADRETSRAKADALLQQGVSIPYPELVFIEGTVTVSAGTTLLPGTHLRGNTSIGADCRIGPDCWIEDSTVESNGVVWYSVLESAHVRQGARIGPYAHLRPGADIGPESRVGNFVEVKAATLGRGTKAGHLAYIGDADVGDGVNIGAGAVTCNYDGKGKHQTTIEDGAFVGTNSSLVAPVCIGENAVIAAGSAITEDVPAHSKAFGRARQVNKNREATPRENKEDA